MMQVVILLASERHRPATVAAEQNRLLHARAHAAHNRDSLSELIRIRRRARRGLVPQGQAESCALGWQEDELEKDNRQPC
jgi:hypothetical protein